MSSSLAQFEFTTELGPSLQVFLHCPLQMSTCCGTKIIQVQTFVSPLKHISYTKRWDMYWAWRGRSAPRPQYQICMESERSSSSSTWSKACRAGEVLLGDGWKWKEWQELETDTGLRNSSKLRAPPTCSTLQRSARSTSPLCRQHCFRPDAGMQRSHSAREGRRRSPSWPGAAGRQGQPHSFTHHLKEKAITACS